MKIQVPNAKLQRSSNRPKLVELDTYPEPNVNDWLLGEDGVVTRHPFDLEERTARFGEAIVRFGKKIPRHPAHDRLTGQLVACGTSVGANYCEANEGVSKKDFRFAIAPCKKEAKETKFFLRMVAVAEPCLAPEARDLFREAKELHLIFCKMYRTAS